MDEPRVANILCYANKTCADRQRVFAYVAAVPKKKAKAKPGQYAEFGAIFRKARDSKGLSQTEVATLLKKTRQGYAHYELGNALPPAGELSKLCEVLGLDAGMFGAAEKVVAHPQHTDDRDLGYLHRLWSALDISDRRSVIEAAEGRLTRRGISLDLFNQPRKVNGPHSEDT